MRELYHITLYKTDSGKIPYMDWEEGLSVRDRAIVTARLVRIRLGNLGDCKTLKGASGIHEVRIDIGPGYRIYYSMIEQQVLLLLCGGDKSHQKRDIQKAQAFWRDYIGSQKRRM